MSTKTPERFRPWTIDFRHRPKSQKVERLDQVGRKIKSEIAKEISLYLK